MITIINIGTDKGNITNVKFKKPYNEITPQEVMEVMKQHGQDGKMQGYADVTQKYVLLYTCDYDPFELNTVIDEKIALGAVLFVVIDDLTFDHVEVTFGVVVDVERGLLNSYNLVGLEAFDNSLANEAKALLKSHGWEHVYGKLIPDPELIESLKDMEERSVTYSSELKDFLFLVEIMNDMRKLNLDVHHKYWTMLSDWYDEKLQNIDFPEKQIRAIFREYNGKENW